MKVKISQTFKILVYIIITVIVIIISVVVIRVL